MPKLHSSSPPQESSPVTKPSPLTIQKYGRFWAIYEQGTLVVVTVYRKGALEVVRRLESGQNNHSRHQP
jgi:hypothetical protein